MWLLVVVAFVGCGGHAAVPRPAASTVERTLKDPDGDGALDSARRRAARDRGRRRDPGRGARHVRADDRSPHPRRGVAVAGAVPGSLRRAVPADLPAAGVAQRADRGGGGAGGEPGEAGGRVRHRRPHRQRPAQRAELGEDAARRRRGDARQRRARLPRGAGGRQPRPLLLPARRRPAAPPGAAGRGAAARHLARARRGLVRACPATTTSSCRASWRPTPGRTRSPPATGS